MRYGTEHTLTGCAELNAAVGLVALQTVIGAGATADGCAVVYVALVAAASALTATLRDANWSEW